MTRRTPKVPEEALEVFKPVFPTDGSLPEEAKRRWEEVWDVGAGLFLDVSIDFIKNYVRNLHMADVLWAQIVNEGNIVSIGSQGQEVESAAFKAYMRLQTHLITMTDRLGLNPRAAGEIGLTDLKRKSEETKFDKFLESINSDEK